MGTDIRSDQKLLKNSSLSFDNILLSMSVLLWLFVF